MIVALTEQNYLLFLDDSVLQTWKVKFQIFGQIQIMNKITQVRLRMNMKYFVNINKTLVHLTILCKFNFVCKI